MSKIYSKTTTDRATYNRIYNALSRRTDIVRVDGMFDCEQKCYVIYWRYRRTK